MQQYQVVGKTNPQHCYEWVGMQCINQNASECWGSAERSFTISRRFRTEGDFRGYQYCFQSSKIRNPLEECLDRIYVKLDRMGTVNNYNGISSQSKRPCLFFPNIVDNFYSDYFYYSLGNLSNAKHHFTIYLPFFLCYTCSPSHY